MPAGAPRAGRMAMAQAPHLLPQPAEPLGDSRSRSNEWHAFARAAGLVGTQGEPPRFHDLRHTSATLAIASGADVRAVGAVLGHANAAMTLNVYADALADSKRAGMERMDRLLSQ